MNPKNTCAAHYGFEKYPPQNPAEFELHCQYVRELQPTFIMEIGSRHGRSTIRLAEAAMPQLHRITCIDLPGAAWGTAGSEQSLRDCLQGLENRGVETALHLIDSHGEEAKQLARMFHRNRIDFLFIDGDHSYEGVKQDFEQFLPCMREGGMIALHDVCGEDRMQSKGVQMGVHRFWKEVQGEFETRTIQAAGSKLGIGVVFLEK